MVIYLNPYTNCPYSCSRDFKMNLSRSIDLVCKGWVQERLYIYLLEQIGKVSVVKSLHGYMFQRVGHRECHNRIWECWWCHRYRCHHHACSIQFDSDRGLNLGFMTIFRALFVGNFLNLTFNTAEWIIVEWINIWNKLLKLSHQSIVTFTNIDSHISVTILTKLIWI